MTEQPLPLDYVEQPNPPPRPTFSDPAVRRAAAEEILPEIIKWLGPDWHEAEREDYLEDLMGIVFEWDGYDAARALERKHWDPDADLVEILDGGWGSRALRRAVAAWVEANKITPQLSVGTTVRARPRGDIGKITGIDLKHATYTVAIPEFLRKHPDQEGRAAGIVVPFEACTPEEPT